MQRFLELCASYIYSRYKEDLHDICIVFPNRRAGVFFTAYLQKLLTGPVIGPDITTINELLHSLSNHIVPDRLLLISILYEVFRRETGTTESFDDFYFWGEVLLSDFDDIDKYDVNSGDLFRNLAGLKAVESTFDYLTDNQKKTLEHFWGSMKNWESRVHQRDFLSIWNKLHAVYSGFRNELAARNLGYPGMIMRESTGDPLRLAEQLTYRRYMIVGLNALNNCEKKLFDTLRQINKVDFFWDYDNYYLDNMANDAGKFLRENLRLYPAPVDFEIISDQFSKPKRIEIVGVPSSYGQSQIIPEFFGMEGEPAEGHFDKTAIVLADESLLFPVLGAIPERIGRINVTMGYPVKRSPVTGFIYLLRSLIQGARRESGRPPKLYFRMVMSVLNHQLLKNTEPEKAGELKQRLVAQNRVYIDPAELHISPLHRLIFSIPSEVAGYPAYFLRILEHLFAGLSGATDDMIVKELIYSLHTSIGKLHAVIKEHFVSGHNAISPKVFFRLMNQYLSQESVPFEGEPLAGIQVMGILETRCLDFENLIIIGLNEEIWPRAYTSPSMIPFNVRKAFGLPGIDDQDAMYAYYFYRLIQRSQRITASWNSIREGVSGGEMSRYAFQLILHSGHKVKQKTLEFSFSGQPARPLTIRSQKSLAEKFLEKNAGGKALSPSAVNTWLTCRLKFYFRYFLGIDEPEEVVEEIDRRVFGNIFHKAVENLYQPYTGKTMQASILQAMRDDTQNIDHCIRKAFNTEYFKLKENDTGEIEIAGKGLLVFSAIRSYIRNLIDLDIQRAPFTILSLEKAYYSTVIAEVDGVIRSVTIGGKIDRIDESGGIVKVIDYKTGGLENSDLGCASPGELFDPEKKRLKKEIVQAMIYSLIVRSLQGGDTPVTASIYAVLKLNDDRFDPSVRVAGKEMEIGEIEHQVKQHLSSELSAIFSAGTEFSQTIFRERCVYCPYKVICRR